MERLWNILGKKLSLLFGRESARAAIWMFIVLLLRMIVKVLRLDSIIPHGFIFAFPLLVQLVGSYVPFMADCFPLLPIRLAESILGRISPGRLTLIIPAHFFGSILGVAAFSTIFPFAPTAVFEPITYDRRSWFYTLLVETTLVCVYSTIIIALPEILIVNKLPLKFLSIPIIPLMFIGVPDSGCSFNPAAVYAMWFVAGGSSTSWTSTYSSLISSFLSLVPASLSSHLSTFIALPLSSSSSSSSSNPLSSSSSASTSAERILQQEHLIAPILGAIAAGLICNRFFPDDGSWKRRGKNS